MSGYSNYDRLPTIQLTTEESDCYKGWPEIVSRLKAIIPAKSHCVVALECYPGVLLEEVRQVLEREFSDAEVCDVSSTYRGSAELRRQFAPTLTEDPVFGVMHPWTITDFFEDSRVRQLRQRIERVSSTTLVIGTGTTHVVPHPDIILHAGVTRWELQARQRAHQIGNLGFDNRTEVASVLYKNAFFLEWRVGDAIRHALYREVNFFLDLDDQQSPSMLAGDTLREGVAAAVHRPFRVVPFFDPGPWGGHWMKDTFQLPDGPPNYAWCFDCVPEENKVIFGFGSRSFGLPAMLLVQEQPLALLGELAYERFGAEFPIRFDLLDTVGGGNLSLQVHPLSGYIRDHFGMPYTQDESYYILDNREGAELYLGLCPRVDRNQMRSDLESAQAGEASFPVARYVNTWPTHRHDHFSIPAGTIHCSGSGNLVLEISATPYIFTFKLWDWNRLGLNGRSRPIHLHHGMANIQWNRDRAWVESELLNQVQKLTEEHGWREERTGLHTTEFLETRRTWFTEAAPHNTEGNLHVLNLVEGQAAIVESPDGAFPPLEIHYAETFIVPASVGPYRVRPLANNTQPLATIKAYLRDRVQ